MITVYNVSSPTFENTRLHLPSSAWGNTVRERLTAMGYAVQDLGQRAEPDLRGKAELARRDELLEWASPD